MNLAEVEHFLQDKQGHVGKIWIWIASPKCPLVFILDNIQRVSDSQVQEEAI